MAALPVVTLLALLTFWNVRAHRAALAGSLVAAAMAIGVYGMPMTSSLFAADLVNRAEPDWWLTPRRMIQTNLREVDAGMNVEAYVASLKAAGANVVLFSVGGIVANYPTELPYHYRNPFMRGDLAGEVVKRLHAEGIRMIARFDFSKVNERIAQEHPEWLTRDADGRSIPAYNGQVPTCLNGWYQQEGMLKILGEVIDRYPIDGVFFNMIGYCIGRFNGQEDRIGLDQVDDVFRFHAANERWLTNTGECADVGLAVEGTGGSPELRGLIGMLSQAHVSYELVSLAKSDLAKRPALIVPVSGSLPADAMRRLDDYVTGGGRLLLTGGPVTPELKSLDLSAAGETRAAEPGTYIRIRPEDKTRLKQPVLAKLDLVPLNGELWTASLAEGGETWLRFIPPAMFGPPEKCYYTSVSDIPCLYARRSDRGTVAWIPWRVGTEFEALGHAGHAALVMGTLDELLKLPRRVRVDGPALVEMNHRADRSGWFEWVSLYKHSGQLDKVIGTPVPIRDVTVEITPASPVKRASLLKSGESLPLKSGTEGKTTCTVPVLNAYDVVLFEY